jgi:hypothetical protein
VLPTSTGRIPGWRRAGEGEVGLTLAAARREGRSGGSGAEAVAVVGEERAPVSGGVVLWLEVEAREVAAARCQSGEGKMRRGGENLAGDGVFILKGSGGEGAGGVGATWKRCGMEQRGGMASAQQRPSRGVRGRRVAA